MIAHLRGTAHKLQPGQMTIDVGGVGYQVASTLDVWDNTEEGAETFLHIYTYVREERLDLFGFADRTTRELFAECMKTSGVGPALGLDICNLPRTILLQAINEDDANLLTNIKGVGKKKAEKLLLDLGSLVENRPELFAVASGSLPQKAAYDQDAVAALQALGYDQSTIMQALKNLPADLESTEDRVSAALRSL